MTENSTAFDGLLVGLAAWFSDKRTYPFPSLLQHACHALALHQTLAPFPRTMTGLLRLMHTPVRSWWPLGIPPEFDADSGLVYDDQLSEEASRYLYQELYERAQLSPQASAELQQLTIENYQFRRLIEQLWAAYDHDPEAAQESYVRLRRFLIEHPYATPDDIHDVFWDVSYLSMADVGGLYGDDLLSGQDYWNCKRCGPLAERYGQLRGVNPSACNDHRSSLSYVQRVPWRRGLRRITVGLHWRVCLPGIPELTLFRALDALQQQHPQRLATVRLWPGIDRYDIRLEFVNGTAWAADMKDYRDPDGLAPHLLPIYGEGDLRYDESFYIIPTRRLQHDNYLQMAREHAKKLPATTQIVSDTTFEQLVLDYIMHMKKGR